MKKFLTISLSVLLLLLSVRDLLTFAAFKLQQETIAAKLCINRYESVPMCFGQCFLDQQIQTNIDQEEHPGSARLPELSIKPVFFQFLSSLRLLQHADLIITRNFHYQGLLSQIVVRKLIEPPRFG
ncbi:hypothetical protein [Flavilitoribacter nigricans]|uniref:hypothetical protein n=1 Tax=Flavilitoribacter nigricans TaxID=70997 RepID=UPI00117A9BCD|nr:hypothetical protein [Flavilitoribacter nigricans]